MPPKRRRGHQQGAVTALQQKVPKVSVPKGSLKGLVCPLSRDIMRDPVICADGHTYDRPSIEFWLNRLIGAD